MKKILLVINFLFSVLVLAQPGTLDTSFNPSDLGFGNGDGPRYDGLTSHAAVYTTKIQSDGKILIGGYFNTYNGTTTNGLARLNSNGTLDASFNLGIGVGTGTIRSISIQNDGKIIVGGYFTSFNGITRINIARLNSDGSLDISFNPGLGPNSHIYSTTIQADGKIIIGGEFTSYNGIGRNRIARINSDGSIDTTFNPGSGTDSYVNSTDIQGDGKIIIAGAFNTFNAIQKKYLARLNSNGSLDTTFNSGSGLNGKVNTISIQNDGGIIVGGEFTTVNGITRNYIARFLNNGTFDSNNFGGNSTPYGNTVATCIQADGKIVVGSIKNLNGVISNYLYRMNGGNGSIDNSYNSSLLTPSVTPVSSISIQNDGKLIIGASLGNSNLTNKCIRLNLDATIDSDFNKNSGANSSIYTTAIQSDGKIIIGGNFVKFNGIVRNKVARLNLNGSLENTINTIVEINSTVLISKIQNDGKILIGAEFSRLKRLNTDLSLETDFVFSPQSDILGISIQNDGNIILGGGFNSSTIFPRNLYGRLYSFGTFDSSFASVFNNNSGYRINCINTLPDSKIIISGTFTAIGSFNAGYIARLNSNGGLDTSFSTNNCNSEVICNQIQNDGKLIIGGAFTLSHGISRNRIARLNYDGTLDASFNPGTGANGIIRTISIQSDGKIIIGGDFTTYNGVSSNYVARLNTDGTLDTTFNIGTGANGIVRTTSIQSDGKIIIGGDFTAYNGIGRNRIARINNTAALSNNRFKKNILNIFPNPSSGYFTLQIDNLIEMKTVEVYTIIGQKIYSKQLTENESTLDLSNQPKGVYIYKIVGLNREMESGKLVIE
jgi:uncharacterized delta-60 repeat protein